MSEKQSENDLFYVCSLLEYIARKTNNKKKYIVEHIGKEKINKLNFKFRHSSFICFL